MKQAIYLACLIAVFLLCPFNAQSQPNITDSIYINAKTCISKFYPSKILVTKEQKVFGISYVRDATNSLSMKLYRLSSSFDTLWSKIYGGSEDDEFEIMRELPNRHILLGGTTSSNDGDVPYGHTYTVKEIWLLEVDTNGSVIRGKTFGGSWSSSISDVYITPWGDIFACGATNAFDYDFTHPMPPFELDGWVVKLDSNLNLRWVKYQGGITDEGTYGIASFNNQEFYYSSVTGDSSAANMGQDAKGEYDLLLTSIDSSGTINWRKRYGGSGNEIFSVIRLDTITKSIYMVGQSRSADKDITYRTGNVIIGNEYNDNIWVLKTDTFGNIKYSKAYGDLWTGVGQIGMDFQDAIFYNNHIWVFAHSFAGDGDMASNINPGNANAWVGKIDTQVNLRAKFTVNTFGYDIFSSSFVLLNELYVKGGSVTPDSIINTFSCDTSKDFSFFLKLGEAPNSIIEYDKRGNKLFNVYPNPATQLIHIKLLDPQKTSIKLLNKSGQLLYSNTIEGKVDYEISTSDFPAGLYYLKVSTIKNSTTEIINLQ